MVVWQSGGMFDAAQESIVGHAIMKYRMHVEVNVSKAILSGVLTVFTCVGCATSGDMSYKYQDNEAECTSLARQLVEQQTDSKHKKSLSLKYHRDCVGK